MSGIKSAAPWKIPASKHRSRTDRPGKAKTTSPLSKGYGRNRNPSGSHLEPDYVSGNRNPKSGSHKGLGNMKARTVPASRNPQGDHLKNTIPKAKPGKSGTYKQK